MTTPHSPSEPVFPMDQLCLRLLSWTGVCVSTSGMVKGGGPAHQEATVAAVSWNTPAVCSSDQARVAFSCRMAIRSRPAESVAGGANGSEPSVHP